MKHTMIKSFAAISLLASSQLMAASADKLMVMDSWVRAAPPTAKVQAAFFNLMNHNNADINLVAVDAAGFGYSELHLSSKKNGMMVMEKQDKITVKANSTLKFKPGSYHIMLLAPEKIIPAGQNIDVTFTLANGEKFSAKMPVKRDNSKMGMKMDHSKMNHGKMDHSKMDHSKMPMKDMKHDDMQTN